MIIKLKVNVKFYYQLSNFSLSKDSKDRRTMHTERDNIETIKLFNKFLILF